MKNENSIEKVPSAKSERFQMSLLTSAKHAKEYFTENY